MKKITVKKYGEVDKLHRAIELEKKIDFTAANVERRQMISELNEVLKKKELEALVLNAVAFREGHISKTDFHEYLLTLGERYSLPLDQYMNLVMFADYMKIYEGLNISTLHLELEKLEREIREKLYRKKDEAVLYQNMNFAHMLEKLYSVELSDRGYEKVLSHKNKYSPEGISAFVNDFCKRYGIMMTGKYDARVMLSGMDRALSFFATARRRDLEMIGNTIFKMKKEGKKVAALITGGFHTRGLTQLMRDKKLSYVVVSPKYEESAERPYFFVLTGKTRAYTDLLEEGKYNIAVYDFSNNQTPDDMKRSARKLLASARLLDGKDPAKISESWKEKYRKLQSLRQKNVSRSGPVIMSPDEFDKMLGNISVKIISSKAIVLEKGKPAAVFEKTDDGNGVRETKLTAKLINAPEIAGTDFFPDLDPGDSGNFAVENIISRCEDMAYISSVTERLPERASRKGFKDIYVLKILRRDGILTPDWAENKRLEK
jgi:hypothetical protein